MGSELLYVKVVAGTQDGIDESVDEDADDHIDIDTLIAGRSVLLRDILAPHVPPTSNITIEQKNASADGAPPKQTYEDAARIMDPEVHARPAVDQRPKDQSR